MTSTHATSTAAATQASTTALPNTFEDALAELETLVENMSEGNVPLQQLMANYERGVQLQAFCESQLATAQQQLSVLENGVLNAVPVSVPATHNAGTAA